MEIFLGIFLLFMLELFKYISEFNFELNNSFKELQKFLLFWRILNGCIFLFLPK